jgi:flagellar protein FliO/FliZ
VDQVMLVVRVVLSLLVVLAMMWGLSKALRGRQAPGRSPSLEVLSRTAVGRHASVVVLRTGDKGLVVGVTEHTISVLGEMELPQEAAAEVRTPLEITADGRALEPGPAPRPRHRAAAPAGTPSALAGSVLSPSTWRQTASALRERTVRT